MTIHDNLVDYSTFLETDGVREAQTQHVSRMFDLPLERAMDGARR